jgi:hypothetical protein
MRWGGGRLSAIWARLNFRSSASPAAVAQILDRRPSGRAARTYAVWRAIAFGGWSAELAAADALWLVGFRGLHQSAPSVGFGQLSGSGCCSFAAGSGVIPGLVRRGDQSLCRFS